MEKDRRSPEEVAKAGKMGYIDVTVSAKTVYNYIHYHMKGELKKLALGTLRQKGGKRKNSKEGEKRGKLIEMTLIDERPAGINGRTVPGNWEGDRGKICRIIGKGRKSAPLVTVERQKRYVMISRLLNQCLSIM